MIIDWNGKLWYIKHLNNKYNKKKSLFHHVYLKNNPGLHAPFLPAALNDAKSVADIMTPGLLSSLIRFECRRLYPRGRA